MSKSTQENYLDELLSSVNDNKTPEELEMLSLKSQLQKMREGVEDSWNVSSFAEEEFLRKFEEELEEENMDSFLSEFEQEVDRGLDEDLQPAASTLEEELDLQIRQEEEKNTKKEKKSAKEKGKRIRSRKERKGKSKNREDSDGMESEEETVSQDPGTEQGQDGWPTEERASGLEDSDYIADSIDDIVSEENLSAGSAAEPEGQNFEETAGVQMIDESDLSEFGDIVGEIQAESDLSAEIGEGTLLTPDGEIDLSGQSDMDLLELLAGQDGLSELGDILSGETEVSDTDEIGNYAEQQMQETEEAQGDSGEQEKKKKRFGRKQGEEGDGFLAKLIRLFFGSEEDEEEPIPEQDEMEAVEDISMTAENLRILDELSEEESGGKERGKKGKKAKKEKPKKEKPKKEKPKKEKRPKPKKEKIPKETEPVKKGPKLPKAPVILIIATLAALVVVIILGTNQVGYNNSITEAKQILAEAQKLQGQDQYIAGVYTKALECLSGKKMKSGDEEFYQQIRILATVEAELEDYEAFREYGDEIASLDSLVCAAGRYSLHKDLAKEYECTEQLEQIRAAIQKYLAEEYSMSLEEAVEIYNARTRKEYSETIRIKIHELGLDEK